MRALAALTIGGAVLVIGCATGTEVEETTGPGGAAGAQNDASNEEVVAPPDAAKEASSDAMAEAGEAASEAGPDVAKDVAPEVAPDAPKDAPAEAAPDVVQDVAPEAADPCVGMVCKTPPVNVCNLDELEVFNATGTCSAGVCIYSSKYVTCPHGCSMGQCNADPCIGITCAKPPTNTCTNASYLKVFDVLGTCSEGDCTYGSHEEYCAFGCANDACNGDPCIGKTCNTPEVNYCADNSNLVVYDTPGTCSNGTCSYTDHKQFCAFGCAFGACKNDPCAGLTCNTPNAAYCVDATTLKKYDATGSCSGGNCTYASTDVVCPNGCVDGACKECANDGQCSAGKWCSSGTCVACAVDARCGSTCTDCVAIGQICQGGTTCACAAATKLCDSKCVPISQPQTGCTNADCAACPLPAFATGADCSGAAGTCGFACDASLHRVAQGNACVCDAAGHWVEVNGACECGPGYVNHSGNCVVNCTGTVAGSSCYWYEGAAMTFDAAEAACAGKSGHLASIADAAENTTVRTLATSDAWFGLRDLQGLKTASGSGDDCTNAKLLDPLGGRYSESSYYATDDVGPCSKTENSSADMFFRLEVATRWTWVFAASSSWIDTYIGLWTRGDGTGYTGCLSSFLECDDDDGPSTSSRIIRTLDPGSYMFVVDATSYEYEGDSFTLNARRFTFTDGTAHIYQNWKAEEPNNSGNSEGCAEILKATGTWNDRSCGDTRPAVCEKPLGI